MAKFYIGMAGGHFVIGSLKATHPVEALEELRRRIDADGWLTIDWAEQDDASFVRFNDICVIKPYTGVGPRERGMPARMPELSAGEREP